MALKIHGVRNLLSFSHSLDIEKASSFLLEYILELFDTIMFIICFAFFCLVQLTFFDLDLILLEDALRPFRDV